MFNQPQFVFALIFFLFGFQTNIAAEKVFSNPLIHIQTLGCNENNLDSNRFSAAMDVKKQVVLCQSVAQVAERLNQGKWSGQLDVELAEIWQTFSTQDVFFAELPDGTDSGVLALTESFPPGKMRNVFSASIRLKNGIEDKKWFYHVLLHELRHVFDFNELFIADTDLPTVELERRAFCLMSLLDEQTPEAIRFSKVPQLWKDQWKQLPPNIRQYKRNEAIAKFLKKSDFYKNLPPPKTNQPTALIKPNYNDEFGAPPKLRRRVPKNSLNDSASTEGLQP